MLDVKVDKRDPTDLHVRGASGKGIRRITHGQRASFLSWSPDGRSILFVNTARVPQERPLRGGPLAGSPPG